ncbi:MAG TPA: rhodanese-like domain-containing protein [bacterium]|nr:rhodanese-like domain-containing protein [bacterium]
MVGKFILTCLSYLLFNAELSAVQSITAQQALAYVNSPDAIFLDVREPAEYENGHIVGSILMPWFGGVLQERWNELPVDKLIIVYCSAGSRSASAASFLESKGFTRVANMGRYSSFAALPNAPVETGPYQEPSAVSDWESYK